MSENRTAFIVGAGQQARVIASLLGHRNIRFLVERDPIGDQLLQDDIFAGPPDPTIDYLIGIGNNRARRKIFDRLLAWGATPASCVADNAWIAADVQLGRGLFLAPGTVVMTGARIADNVLINTGSTVDHDTVIGADSQVTVGVTIGSSITVGTQCYFGIKSAVVPGITIGDQVMVMAGALVAHDVPSRTKVGGLPAVSRPFNARDQAYVQTS